MHIYDISWPISPTMTAYKNRSIVALQATKTFAVDNVRESCITLGSHTGTHIDAPAHFLADGATTDQLDVHATVGKAYVVDLTHVTQVITAEIIAALALPLDGAIVLLKTKNSALDATAPFDDQFVYLDASGAAYLVAAGVRAVGIDYLGIERNQPGHPTHTTLLQAGCAIIEGLRLASVPAGTYTLWCLPLALQRCDGAPARALLVVD